MVVKQEDCCYVCGCPWAETHHCLYGNGKRELADKYGLTIRLCRKHHNEVHAYPNTGLDLKLKIMAQEYYEKNIGTREQFIKEFVKSYL